MRLALDRTARRLDGGRVLVAGSPLTVFRLGPAGQRVLDALTRGDELPPRAQPLIDRLLDTGAAHPRPAGRTFGSRDVTVVVPARDHDPQATVERLGPVADVVVVDDASARPLTVAGVRVVRHTADQGPAAARTTGRRAATTALVAFVDADCLPEDGWLEPLLAHFDDDRVALVAPRVRSRPGRGAIARYEVTRSPLDLGPIEGRVAPTTRIAYVPAAALLVRAAALDAVGGFDPSLRVGEDVDLVWRLVAAGWRCRYEPRSTVTHHPRPTLPAFARQRFGYGRSAAALDRRHPGLVSPAIVGPWAAAGWITTVAGSPVTGAILGLVPVAALRRDLPPMPERDRLALRLAAFGFLRAGQQLASCLTRIWWPASLVAVLSARRARPLLLAAAAPAVIDWARTRSGPPSSHTGLVTYLALRAVDDLSYGAGVWAGAIAQRRPGALIPRVARRLRDRAGQNRPRPPRPPSVVRR